MRGSDLKPGQRIIVSRDDGSEFAARFTSADKVGGQPVIYATYGWPLVRTVVAGEDRVRLPEVQS